MQARLLLSLPGEEGSRRLQPVFRRLRFQQGRTALAGAGHLRKKRLPAAAQLTGASVRHGPVPATSPFLSRANWVVYARLRRRSEERRVGKEGVSTCRSRG